MSVHQTVPVIFRRWPNGDICALFPTVAFDYEGRHCTAYSHIGQHGAADYGHVIAQTKPSTPDEYAPLMRELESIGYENLRVYREDEFMPEKTYNHMFDLAFSVRSSKYANPEDCIDNEWEDIKRAIVSRLASLDEDGGEALGHCDTYENRGEPQTSPKEDEQQ